MSRIHPTSRREFLTGKAAARALLDIAPSGNPSGTLDPLTPGTYAQPAQLICVSRPAMACQFEIHFGASQYPAGTEAAVAALDMVERLEDQLSVYREWSELSEINRTAGTQPVKVERQLFGLLEQAAAIFAETQGAFDATSGPLSKAWGFYRRQGRVPSEQELAEALARVGFQQVRLDANNTTVQFLAPGIELNVNSIGKGYAVDRAASELAARGIHDFLIHGGQSSVLAKGSHPATAGRGWSVGLRHPLQRERRLAELLLEDRALATSGSGIQFFHDQGQRYGHVIDPRTGRPAEGVLSATVLAPTAAQADALATAFYVMGPEESRCYCESHAEITMVLVCPAESDEGVVLHTHGLDDRSCSALGPPHSLVLGPCTRIT